VGEEREAEALATEAAVLDEGRRLYHAVGCVACHGALASQAEILGDDFLDDGVPDVDVRAPFGDLAGKWRPSALARFLFDPSQTHPDGRMPGMDLTQDQCDRLATYLATEFGPATSAQTPPGAMSELLTLAMCTACHELPGWQGYAGSGDLADLDPSQGCLAEDDPRSPDYDLSDQQRADLRAGLASVRAASGAHAPLEELERRVDALGCLACHERDGLGGVDPRLDAYFQSADEKTDLGDEGRLPPDLTGLGTKLTSSWMHDVLVDGERDRTYLAARMPHYGAAAVGELAELFSRREGLWPGSDFERPPSSDEDRIAGRMLMGRSALACITCHSFRDLPPAGSPGPSIDRFSERLRYEWTMAYMCDPARYKRDTRMPSFLSDGKSAARDVLDGDFGHQVDAMWGYFELGEFMPVPPGLESARGNTLQVGDRPIVLRTFLEDAGSRGIAVGQPNGLHYAFDATTCRLVSVWRGAFLDASGAWAGRGGTVSGGRGERLWSAPGGPTLWIGDEPAPGAWPESAEVRFRGYRLDADGYPTFLYEQDGARVELAIRPRYAADLEVVRRVRVEDPERRVFTLRIDVTRPVDWRFVLSGEEQSTGVVRQGPDRLSARTLFDRPADTLEVIQ
jgi:mono/diheme cytochrome c family protein